MTFCLPPGEQFLGYPVAGSDNDLRPGRRRYNIIWYRRADEAELNELPWLLTDARGILHSISIPPPLIRGDAIAAMREAQPAAHYAVSTLYGQYVLGLEPKGQY